MRKQATWGDLARLHNETQDALTMLRRTLDGGVSDDEATLLRHAQHELEAARSHIRTMIAAHPKNKAGVAS